MEMEMESVWIWILLVMALIGAWVGSRKEMGVLGFVLGGFLGLIGVLIIALIPGNMLHCPNCHSMIPNKALVCRYCGRSINAGG